MKASGASELGLGQGGRCGFCDPSRTSSPEPVPGRGNIGNIGNLHNPGNATGVIQTDEEEKRRGTDIGGGWKEVPEVPNVPKPAAGRVSEDARFLKAGSLRRTLCGRTRWLVWSPKIRHSKKPVKMLASRAGPHGLQFASWRQRRWEFWAAQPRPMIPRETLLLEQSIFLKASQRLEICQDGNLEVTFKKAFARRQFKIPLWTVMPHPERIQFRQGGDLIGMIFFGLLSVGLLIPMLVTMDIGMVEVLVVPLVACGVVSARCLWRWKSSSTDILAFNLRGRGQLHVWFGKPDQESFDRFCETLTRKAEQAWNDRPLEQPTNGFAAELAALKKLKDTGVLDENEFARAKAKLLGDSQERRIGFA